MKKIVTVIVLILFSTIANAQWTTQTTTVTSTLYGVYYPSTSNGWLVGDDGYILKTINGGTAWSSQQISPYNSLKSVYFTGATKGIIVGQSGTILITTDGSSWGAPTSSPTTTNTLRSVYFATTSNGSAVGDAGTIFNTTDGGANWVANSQSGSITTNALRGVAFSSSTNGVAVGASGTILRTTDGGASWTSITPLPQTSYQLWGVLFRDINNGCAVGGGGVVETTSDGGGSWTLQAGVTGSPELHAISFINGTSNGWTISTSGKIYQTTDGGVSWTQQTSPTTAQLYGIFFTSVSNGTIVGDATSGTSAIVTTTNGGLPVELASFSASVVNGTSVNLTWKTDTEVNNYGFNVERSSTNSGWQKIGFVAGSGNSNSPKNYSFADNPTGGTSFRYRLKQIDVNGDFKYYDAVSVNLTPSTQAQLLQNSPNPFNPSTTIKFYIPNTSDVTIKIYDILGREITTLINQQTTAGYHNVYWNGRDSRGEDVASGVYLYRLTAGSFSETKKMNLLK